jgi:hypothetical protein
MIFEKIKCWLGFHEYIYCGEKHGMVTHEGGVKGTISHLYVCDSPTCDHEKITENREK